MFVKGPEVAKYLRGRAKGLVKGKGRLLTFALVTSDAALASPATVRAFYAALGDNGEPTVLYPEEPL